MLDLNGPFWVIPTARLPGEDSDEPRFFQAITTAVQQGIVLGGHLVQPHATRQGRGQEPATETRMRSGGRPADRSTTQNRSLDESGDVRRETRRAASGTSADALWSGKIGWWSTATNTPTTTRAAVIPTETRTAGL